MNAYIGTGSNLGNRIENIRKALDMIKDEKGIKIKKISSVYETEPEGLKRQMKFLNCVVKITTSLLPYKLLLLLQTIENKLKRKRIIKWGPRSIDLDILVYGNVIKSNGNLSIPHPMLHKRAFVLVPFAEINPDFIHPVLKSRISTLLSRLNNTSGVKLYSNTKSGFLSSNLF